MTKNGATQKKKLTAPFVIIVIVVVAFHLVGLYLGLNRSEYLGPALMFRYGLFGLIPLNFFAFAISLVKPFRTALRIDKEPIPQDQKDRKAQEILEPSLGGQADLPKKSQRIFQFLGQICLGLMAGPIVAWIIKLFLRRFGGCGLQEQLEDG